MVLINAGRSAAANSPKRYVYISEIQGDVRFNEAGKDLPVSTKGDMVSITPQTGLKTLDGHIRLGTTDGSTIILDTQSAIQFGSPGSASDKTGTFFDHLYGRSLLINGQKTPGQGGIRLPNGFSVNVAQSIVGIEFHPENSDPLEVDCLVGSCQVITQKQSTVIMGGEHVRIAGDGTIHPVDQARFTLWAALGGGDIPLPPTETATLTALPTQTAVVKSATPTPTQTASASPTLTASPTASSTASQTPTLTPTWRYIPPTKTKSPTNTPERPPEIVPTDPPPATNTAPPPPPPPPPTDVPAPTIAPFPTYTPIPAPTVTPEEPPPPPPGG